MGVKGLYKYVEDNDKVMRMREIRLKELTLVADGPNLLYGLMNGAKYLEFGGDYMHYYEYLKNFFDKIKESGINLYIVMDGGNNLDMKKNEKKRRARKKIIKMIQFSKGGRHNLPLPLFLYPMFYEIIKQSNNVQFVICDQEADLMVASLANQLDGFAVSDDSDLLLSDIQNGIINVKSLCNGLIRKPKEGCRFYHRRNLANHFGVREDLLPLLALVLGNDYTVGEHQSKLRKAMEIKSAGTDALKEFADYLVKENLTGRSIDEILEGLCGEDREMVSQLQNELTEYVLENLNDSSQQYVDYFRSGEKHKSFRIIIENRSTLRQLVIDLVKAGFLSAATLDLQDHLVYYTSNQAELIDRESTSVCSSDLRKCFYSLVLETGSIVKETFRVGRTLETQEIEVTANCFAPLFDLLQKPTKERQIFMMDLMLVPPNKRLLILEISNTPSAFFLMCLRYFLQMTLISNEECQALLSMHIQLKYHTLEYGIPKYLDQNLVHIFNSFHSVFYYASVTNTLLGLPFSLPEIRYILCGSLFQYACQQGDSIREGFDGNDLADFTNYNDFVNGE